jgi:hypothetical protein
MRSQSLWNLDFSVFRQFPIKEHTRLELRGEAFNLFNTVVYGIPGTSISQPTRFGHITSTANNARSLQIGAKRVF